MAHAVRKTVTVVSDASGDGIGYSDVVTGRIISAAYVKTDYTDGVDFTITTEITLQTIWSQLDVNASVTVVPRQATHNTAGVAALYAAAGTAVNTYIVLAQERIKVVIAQGGATKTGKFTFAIEGA